jgi:2-dehydropantoate 2-reductase
VKVLVYGAGVIGTVYAGKLAEAGHEVTMVARDRRLADIRQHGLALEDIVHRRAWTAHVATTPHLSPDDEFDLALITVRRDQLAKTLPELATNKRIPTLLFMLNNPAGSASLAEALGRDRVMLGFPGIGGTRDGRSSDMQ